MVSARPLGFEDERGAMCLECLEKLGDQLGLRRTLVHDVEVIDDHRKDKLQPEIEPEKSEQPRKLKYNISDEERERRSRRMKEHWAKKRQEKVPA